MMRPTVAPAPRRRARLGRPRLLIVGCGDVGLRIVACLQRRFRVFATTSTPAQCERLRAAGAQPVVVDLDCARTAPLAGLASRIVYLVPPSPHGSGDARIGRLLQGLRRTRPRIVYVSTTGVYGDRGGQLIDETARPAPKTSRAQRRLDAETRLRGHPWHASVLRVPGIYGPGRLPADRLKQARPAALPAQDVLTNHIHADDLARICIAALLRAAPRRIYNAVDDSCLPMGEYLDLVADRLDLPRPPRLAFDQLRQALTPIQFSFFEESRRLANRRLKRELRVRLRYPTVHDGLAAIA